MPYMDIDSSFMLDAFQYMKENADYQDDPELGPFWYDPVKQECYGVHSTPAADCSWYDSKQFNQRIKTGRALHQSIWKKEFYRKKDPRFTGDYKLKPRGRVFQFEDGTFVVCTGGWLSKYSEARREIIQEFNLPENAQFVHDEHWDIGHGFSQEF